MPRIGTFIRKGGRAIALFCAFLCLAGEPKDSTVPEKAEVVLEWDAIEGAETYRLEISERKDFKKTQQSFDLNEPQKKIIVRYGRTYYWRVAGKNFLGDLGDWSDIGTLAVEAPPPVVEAKAPPPPPKPPEKVKTAAKRLKPKFPAWVRGGLSGYYHFENITGTDYKISNSGLPTGKLHLSGALTSDRLETELRLVYQKQSFTVQDSNLPDLQEPLSLTYFSLSGLWRGPFQLFGYSGTLGASIKRRPNFVRKLGETLSVEAVDSYSLLAGLSNIQRLSGPWYWKWETLAEIAPLGTWRTLGVSVETTFGYAIGKGNFAPELVLGINPSVSSVSPNVDMSFQCDFSATLLLKWSFGFGATPVAAKVSKLAVPATPEPPISPLPTPPAPSE